MPTTGGGGQMSVDKYGNKLVKGPNGKLVPAPKVQKPATRQPGTTASNPGGTSSTYVPRPTMGGASPGGATGSSTATYRPAAASGVGSPTVPNPIIPYATPGAAVPSGGVQPAAQGSGVPGATTDLDKSLYGLAASFTPDMLNYVYANPEQVLKQLMINNGQDPNGVNSGLYAASTPYMDALAALRPLAFGGGGVPDSSSAINWMGSQMQQGQRPGGEGIDFTQVLNALRSQTADPNSAISGMLNGPGMDPMDQYSTAKDLVLRAASVGLPPEFQTAMKNQLARAYDNYMTGMVTGQGAQQGNFLNYFLNSANGYTRGY